jgi:hypothetical protein
LYECEEPHILELFHEFGNKLSLQILTIVRLDDGRDNILEQGSPNIVVGTGDVGDALLHQTHGQSQSGDLGGRVSLTHDCHQCALVFQTSLLQPSDNNFLVFSGAVGFGQIAGGNESTEDSAQRDGDGQFGFFGGGFDIQHGNQGRNIVIVFARLGNLIFELLDFRQGLGEGILLSHGTTLGRGASIFDRFALLG